MVIGYFFSNFQSTTYIFLYIIYILDSRRRDYIAQLAWERLVDVPPERLEEMVGEKEVWAGILFFKPFNNDL